MTEHALNEAALNVYAALRHLTVAQVSAVANLTVGEVVRHAWSMEFVVEGEEEAPAPRAPASRGAGGRKLPLSELDDMVYEVIRATDDWIAIGEIQGDATMDGISIQRVRRAIYRLIEEEKVQSKGEGKSRMYKRA